MAIKKKPMFLVRYEDGVLEIISVSKLSKRKLIALVTAGAIAIATYFGLGLYRQYPIAVSQTQPSVVVR